MLRSTLLAAARSDSLRRAVQSNPLTRPMVARFVAGNDIVQALPAIRELTARGLRVSLDRLGEDTTDATQAAATVDAYTALIHALAEAGIASSAEISVKLSAVGQALPRDGEKIARDHAFALCQAAGAAGMTVTLDMEDHTTTESTLGILAELRAEHPWVGAVLQAYLRRTESDCRELAHAGSRIRLCKGAYAEPPSVAFTRRADVDSCYVRCLKTLFAGDGYPMVASHDPTMIAIATELAVRADRSADSYEFQMLYGIRPDEQLRLVRAGQRVRVYVPYGGQWYGYFMRRLAERPANVGFFLRSLVGRS